MELATTQIKAAPSCLLHWCPKSVWGPLGARAAAEKAAAASTRRCALLDNRTIAARSHNARARRVAGQRRLSMAAAADSAAAALVAKHASADSRRSSALRSTSTRCEARGAHVQSVCSLQKEKHAHAAAEKQLEAEVNLARAASRRSSALLQRQMKAASSSAKTAPADEAELRRSRIFDKHWAAESRRQAALEQRLDKLEQQAAHAKQIRRNKFSTICPDPTAGDFVIVDAAEAKRGGTEFAFGTTQETCPAAVAFDMDVRDMTSRSKPAVQRRLEARANALRIGRVEDIIRAEKAQDKSAAARRRRAETLEERRRQAAASNAQARLVHLQQRALRTAATIVAELGLQAKLSAAEQRRFSRQRKAALEVHVCKHMSFTAALLKRATGSLKALSRQQRSDKSLELHAARRAEAQACKVQRAAAFAAPWSPLRSVVSLSMAAACGHQAFCSVASVASQTTLGFGATAECGTQTEC